MFRRTPLLAAFFVIVLVGIIAVSLGTRSAESTPADEPKLASRLHPVETTVIQLDDHYARLQSYAGEVVARRSADLGFERMGRVVAIDVQEGAWVESATPLAHLDTDRLQEMRAELEARLEQQQAILDERLAGPRAESIAAAEATVRDLTHQHELWKQKHSRQEKLFAQNTVPEEVWEEIDFGAKSIAARLAAAQHQLDELLAGTREEQIAAQRAAVAQSRSLLEQNEIELQKSILHAPFTGTVTARHADEGQVVPQGQPILRLVEDAAPEVWIGIPPAAADKLSVGDSYPIAVNGRTHEATLVAVLPELDTTTRTLTAIFTIGDATIRQIPAGLTARLELDHLVDEPGAWLPLAAIVKGVRGLWSCFKLVEQHPDFPVPDDVAAAPTGTIERCDVEVLHVDGDRVYLRGAFNDGDQIIQSGPDRVAPGQWVYATNRAPSIASR